MNRAAGQFLLVSLLLLAAWTAPVSAQGDLYRIQLHNGQTSAGRLTEVTKNKVILQLTQAAKEFPVNEIKYLQIPGEPRELLEARNCVLDGRNDRAIEWLDKIPPPQLANEAVKQDAEYYRALALARQAMGGVGDAKAAGTALIAFLNSNKNSYHFYEANEATGDLLLAMGRYEQAPTYYKELEAAPWPEFRMRAAVATGRALQAQGKHEDALKQFDTVLNLDNKGKGAEAQASAAKIGKAKCLVELGRAKDAIPLLAEAVKELPGEDNQLLALAYNARGDAYLKLQQSNEALWSYLYVDTLYNQTAESHAEALYHLKDLWAQANKPDRAKKAADTLKSRYPGSPWNK